MEGLTMKATINGIVVEGTPEELSAFGAMFATPTPKMTKNNRVVKPTNLDAFLAIAPTARATMYREIVEHKRAAGNLSRFDLYLLNQVKPKNGETAVAYWTRERIAALPDDVIVEALDYGIAAHGWSASTACAVYRDYRKAHATTSRDTLVTPMNVTSAEVKDRIKGKDAI